jgi:hypothetical protein
MAKTSKSSVDAGAVAAAFDYNDDAILKFGKNQDTIRGHVSELEGRLDEATKAAEAQKVADERTIQSMREQYQRDTDGLKAKLKETEDRLRKIQGILA